jgi:hypothetical protein
MKKLLSILALSLLTITSSCTKQEVVPPPTASTEMAQPNDCDDYYDNCINAGGEPKESAPMKKCGALFQ